jgi:hypothetical protein
MVGLVTQALLTSRDIFTSAPGVCAVLMLSPAKSLAHDNCLHPVGWAVCVDGKLAEATMLCGGDGGRSQVKPLVSRHTSHFQWIELHMQHNPTGDLCS